MNHLNLSSYSFVVVYGLVGTAIVLFEWKELWKTWKTIIVFLIMMFCSGMVCFAVGNVSLWGDQNEGFNNTLSRNYPLLSATYFIFWFAVSKMTRKNTAN